jgi:hypothetical protein
MPQIKVYGLQKNLEAKRFALSHAIHTALMEAIGTPNNMKSTNVCYKWKTWGLGDLGTIYLYHSYLYFI